ncbi:hypothetical protein ACJX0J_014445, partial [Zea mays]
MHCTSLSPTFPFPRRSRLPVDYTIPLRGRGPAPYPVPLPPFPSPAALDCPRTEFPACSLRCSPRLLLRTDRSEARRGEGSAGQVVVRLVGWVAGMSTAVARPAHGGFRRSGSGKPDPDEADRMMQSANGYLVQEEEEEEHGDEAAARREDEDEAEAVSEASSIGAALSDSSSSIGENSASDKEEEEEVESTAQGLGMMGLATLESLDDALHP